MIGSGRWGKGNQTTKADYIQKLAKVVGDNAKLHDALIKKEGEHYDFLKGIFRTQWSAKFFDRIVDAYLEESK